VYQSFDEHISLQGQLMRKKSQERESLNIQKAKRWAMFLTSSQCSKSPLTALQWVHFTNCQRYVINQHWPLWSGVWGRVWLTRSSLSPRTRWAPGQTITQYLEVGVSAIGGPIVQEDVSNIWWRRCGWSAHQPATVGQWSMPTNVGC